MLRGMRGMAEWRNPLVGSCRLQRVTCRDGHSLWDAFRRHFGKPSLVLVWAEGADAGQACRAKAQLRNFSDLFDKLDDRTTQLPVLDTHEGLHQIQALGSG